MKGCPTRHLSPAPAVASFSMSLPSPAILVGWLFFSSLGMVAVGWAKMKQRWLPGAIGVALMVYPYFIPDGPLFWITGSLLTIIFFLPKRWIGL